MAEVHGRRRGALRQRGGLSARGARPRGDLFEMRPVQGTPAHQTDLLGEVVCTNSFKSSIRPTPTGC
jgi:folate-dependent tRNA-U54 methylase TrmFO/GidA